MEPTRSTLTVQFGPVGSRCAPFWASKGQKRSKRVTTPPPLTTILLLPLLLLLLTAILPRFHGTYQVYLDRAVKGHHSGTSDYYTTITTATTATNCYTTTLSWNLPDLPWSRGQKRSKRVTTAAPLTTILLLPLLLLLLTAVLPRFHRTYQILDRAVWAGWQPLRRFSGLQGPETVKKGHHRCLPVLPVIYKCSVNCSAVAAALFFGPPKTRKRGHHSGLSVVYLCDYNITITTATIATTTILPRFHGTYQLPWPCSLGRLAAAATLFRPPAWNGQKGSPHRHLLPLLLLLLTAILPRFHGTCQIWPCSLGRLARDL